MCNCTVLFYSIVMKNLSFVYILKNQCYFQHQCTWCITYQVRINYKVCHSDRLWQDIDIIILHVTINSQGKLYVLHCLFVNLMNSSSPIAIWILLSHMSSCTVAFIHRTKSFEIRFLSFALYFFSTYNWSQLYII